MHDPKEKLSPLWIVSYSLGGFGMNLTNLIVTQWLFERYVIHGVLPPLIYQAIYFAGRLTDGFCDPLIAFWTDRTRTRSGRRIPFLRFATLPFALVCLLLWVPPDHAPLWGKVLYTVVFTQLYFLLYGTVVTPYLALIPELAHSDRLRLNLTTGQAIGALIGTLIFSCGGLVIQWAGFAGLGWILAGGVLISFFPMTFVIRENPPPNEQGSIRELFTWILEVARNREFQPLLLATSCCWFGISLLLMLVPRMVDERMHLPTGAATAIMLPLVAVSPFGFFAFNLFARKFGKYRGMQVSLILSAIIFPLFGFIDQLFPASPLLGGQLVAALAGLPVAAFSVLPFALLAEVIDADAVRCGQRREAIYFGVQAIFQKALIGLSLGVFALLNTMPNGLSWVSLSAGAACLAGFFLFLTYPFRGR